RRKDLDFRGRIDVRQDPAQGTISFSDDGIGLTPEDAEKYLGTVGSGLTGMIKRSQPVPDSAGGSGDRGDLIGQFGVGLFSAFMLADRMIVESRHDDADSGILWEAGAGTEIDLSPSDRSTPGTTVT